MTDTNELMNSVNRNQLLTGVPTLREYSLHYRRRNVVSQNCIVGGIMQVTGY